jgi:hypothetical protein
MALQACVLSPQAWVVVQIVFDTFDMTCKP